MRANEIMHWDHKNVHQKRDGGSTPGRRAAPHAPSTQHARDAPPPHASTRHQTPHHARPDHNAAHNTPLYCKTHNMRQNTAPSSTMHIAHGPAGPTSRLDIAGHPAPPLRAQNRACAAVREGPSTQNAQAQMRTGHSAAPSACQTRPPTSSRSPAPTQRALPSLPSARHAHAPSRARARRARTAQQAPTQSGSFRSRKCTWPSHPIVISGMV